MNVSSSLTLHRYYTERIFFFFFICGVEAKLLDDLLQKTKQSPQQPGQVERVGSNKISRQIKSQRFSAVCFLVM